MTRGGSVPPALPLAAACTAVLFATSLNAQDSCGSLPEVLQVGFNETQIESTRNDARKLHEWACREENRHETTRDSDSVAAAYFEVFSADARDNSETLQDFQSRFCGSDASTAASRVERNFRQKHVDPNVVAAWSRCRANSTGNRLNPQLDSEQTKASFSITYDARIVPKPPILRGISSATFECRKTGSGDQVGIGGTPIELSPTDVLNIECDRKPRLADFGGREIKVYDRDSLILDFTNGQHRIDFSERREGPAIREFNELQERTSRLEERLDEVEARQLRIESGIVILNSENYPAALNNRGTDRGMVDARKDFEVPFQSAPKVVFGLSTLDIHTEATRVDVRVTSIDERGFTYEFVTWGDTRLRWARANWMAYGQ